MLETVMRKLRLDFVSCAKFDLKILNRSHLPLQFLPYLMHPQGLNQILKLWDHRSGRSLPPPLLFVFLITWTSSKERNSSGPDQTYWRMTS